jgi:hypothetical protein
MAIGFSSTLFIVKGVLDADTLMLVLEYPKSLHKLGLVHGHATSFVYAS